MGPAGFRHDMRPIADLAHAHGAYGYVDGVQAVGMFPIDVGAAGVDFIYQLGAALSFLERVGVAAIETHTVALADRLNRGLRDMGARVVTPLGNRSSIVSFSADPAREAAAYFTKASTDVSIREGGRQVRVSPALFNTNEEIDRFLALARGLVRACARTAPRVD